MIPNFRKIVKFNRQQVIILHEQGQSHGEVNKQSLGCQVDPSTVQRGSIRNGLYERIAARKPLFIRGTGPIG